MLTKFTSNDQREIREKIKRLRIALKIKPTIKIKPTEKINFKLTYERPVIFTEEMFKPNFLNTNCHLCFDKLSDDSGFTTLSCTCQLICHRRCCDEYKKRVYYCIRCLDCIDYLPFKLLLLYGWFDYELKLFKTIKDEYMRNSFAFNQYDYIFMSRRGDFRTTGLNNKNEVDQLVREISQHIKSERKTLSTYIKKNLIELIIVNDLVTIILNYLFSNYELGIVISKYQINMIKN
jgi:hypothetical protein